MIACRANSAWRDILRRLMNLGTDVPAHRVGQPLSGPTRELIGCTELIDMRYPVVTVAQRKLSYEFMAAEARWILTGDNRVETIAPYASSIVQFSDNGITFFGAYGPEVKRQLQYIVDVLAHDIHTRQAVMTIWRKNPPVTKDVPCTVSVQWLVRDQTLHCIDTMRSSDVWLGWPYDVFNFTMLSVYIILALKQRGINLKVGTLRLMAGSQHLYARNRDRALDCMASLEQVGLGPMSSLFWESPEHLISYLDSVSERRAGMDYPEITWLEQLR